MNNINAEHVKNETIYRNFYNTQSSVFNYKVGAVASMALICIGMLYFDYLRLRETTCPAHPITSNSMSEKILDAMPILLSFIFNSLIGFNPYEIKHLQKTLLNAYAPDFSLAPAIKWSRDTVSPYLPPYIIAPHSQSKLGFDESNGVFYCSEIGTEGAVFPFTSDRIEDLSCDPCTKATKIAAKNHLYDVMNTTSQLATSLSVPPIKLYFGCEDLGAAIGSKNAFTAIPIIIGPSVLSDMPQTKFILAHELSHISANDVDSRLLHAFAKFSLLGMSFLSNDFHGFSLNTAIVAGLASMYTDYIEKVEEIAADASAMKVLESTEGAIRFFNEAMEANKKERNTTWLSITVSSTGENRLDLQHPPLQQRKALGMEFATKQICNIHENPE